MTTYTPEEGDLKVIYIPQLPMKAYEVNVGKDLKLAQVILASVVGLSIFEFDNRVKGDYSDIALISRWETDGDGGFDWYDVEDDELEAFNEPLQAILDGQKIGLSL